MVTKRKSRDPQYDLANLPERGEKRIAYIKKYAEDLMAESSFNVSECPVSDNEIGKALRSLKEQPLPEIRTVETISSTRWWCGKENKWHTSAFDDAHWNLGELPLIRNHSGPVYFRTCFSTPEAKRICLSFEAVYDGADIYVNGVRLCRHKGFEPFILDVTKHVRKGKQNILALEVNPERQGGPTGIAGTIKVMGCYSVGIFDPFIWTRSIKGKRASIQVEATVKNTSSRTFKGRIQLELSIAGRTSRRPVKANSKDFSLPAFKSKRVEFTFNLTNPSLWTPGNPRLYLARIRLRDNSSASWVDDDAFHTGIRTIQQAKKSILINGKPTLIKGVSDMLYAEGDYSSTYTLTCPSDRWIVKALLIARKCGANIMRFHSVGGPAGERIANGYAPVANFSCATGYSRIPQIADQLGMFLMWTDRNWLYFGNDVLYKYKPQKLAKLVPPCMRYVRNSPSIIIWEGSNEISLSVVTQMRKVRDLLKEGIPTDTKNERKVLRKMKAFFRQYFELAKREDPSRLILPESFMMTLYATPVVPMDQAFYKDPQLLLDTHDYTGWYTPIENMPELATVWEGADVPIILAECGGEAMPEWEAFRDRQSYLVWRNNLGPSSNTHTAKHLGRPLSKDEWLLSQAWQAYVIEKMHQLVESTGCAGIITCTLADGNPTGYHKGMVDSQRRAKLGYLASARAWTRS